MVNACQAMSYTPLHSLQATKFTNLEDTKEFTKLYSNCNAQTKKNYWTAKTPEKTLNVPLNIAN